MDITSNGTATEWYSYQPSEGAGWAFLVLFATATIAHFILMVAYRAAYFIPFIVGGISKSNRRLLPSRCKTRSTADITAVETFSYYGRVWSSHDPRNFKPFVLYSLLVVPAPVFLAASMYMSLGRVIRALDARDRASLSPKWLTAVFVLNDVLCFIVQIAGIGLQVTTSASVRATGRTVVLIGLIFQIVVFACFVLVAIKFHVRLRRDPTRISSEPRTGRWTTHMWALYVASLCIVVRNLVRVVEYAEGADGFITTHEAMLYVFDGTLMWLVMVIYVPVHPGLLLRRIRRARLSPAGDETGAPLFQQNG